jgi:hypothetical protein
VVSGPLTTELPEWQSDLRRVRGIIKSVVRHVEPKRLSGAEAMALAECLGEIEKAAASGLALLSPRVIETGAYTRHGHASAPDWLGAVTGSAAGAAKVRLAAAEQASVVPELRSALQKGALSVPELTVVAQAGAADPSCVGPLLGLLEDKASHQELAAEAEAAKAAARSREHERARRQRVHAGRHLRWHQCESGGIRGEFFCDEVAWAKVARHLESAAKARWRAAGSGEGAEPFEAHRLDAFLDLLSRSGPKEASARPHCLVLVDATALRRGTTRTGEVCEIDGIGPVPVEAAVELLGEGSVQFIVKEGTDIRTVTKASRDLAQKTAMALLARDRTCVVPGCGKHLGLEGDHLVEFAHDGPTSYENMARLCPAHHAMKSHGHWTLSGGPGRWKWTPPARPPSAGAISRARRLAAAKAKATRNRPRRT